MENYLRLLLALFAAFAITSFIQAQEQQGFISLDCGLPANGRSPYNDTFSRLHFSSDATFIQSGKTGKIQSTLVSRFMKPYTTLRYFPDGIRNCYNLNVEKGSKYLIRATFIYGNYDGHDIKPVFDLYLRPNLWATIDLERAVNGTRQDMLHIPTSNSLQICLVKTGETTPLISALELRPMENVSYSTESDSLNLYNMYYLSKSGSQIRCTKICTNASAPLTIEWSSANPDAQYHLYAHFAELQDLEANETREFSMVWNGQHYYGPLVPLKLNLLTIFNKSPRTCNGGKCNVQLIRTNRSTLPPLLNAFEVFTVIHLPQSETDESDVSAIKSIATSYALSRINWQGDPCVPQQLRWDGLNCTNAVASMPPRLTTLNLSSSGLTGTIAAAIQNLTQLEKLDLSNNNLTGGVPEFLGDMKSLMVIVEGNPRLCLSDPCKKPTKKKVVVPIVVSVASAATVIFVVVLFLVVRMKNPSIMEGLHLLLGTSMANVTFANKKSRRFTYSEVIKMTNNFQRVLGKGGFGMVYHGTVNIYEQVAVKVLSQSSTQGSKEFKAEVDLLLRVHHTNLVSLVGYCYEGDKLALIYEFLPNGDLKQHLTGLEYLHIGCTPPMVHRDVKTANILLDENLKAKLADFGLSRSFQSGGESQVLSAIAGTLGYLDPECNSSGRLSEKSDVYSFGIVLLEMITNQPVINQTSEILHITQWVGFKISRGDIIEIMDPNLGKDYDSNSAWRALELALSCANPSSSKRPSMSQVIQELKECIVCENSRVNDNQGLESQAMSIGLDSSMDPMAR
uniref:Protein kinase domain-containing protein n=1 Tax=Brassica campestris TaxID=3711 RepID=M4DUV7_BRACM